MFRFVEGIFRLHNGDWHVFIVSRFDLPDQVVVRQDWHSGVRGAIVRFFGYFLKRAQLY